MFDAMGTLLDLAPLERRIGSKAALDAWFERTLHSAASLTLSGGFAPFREIARAALATTAARLELRVDVEQVMGGFGELEPFPDAAEAVALATNAAVLTNGGAEDTEKLLRRGGIEMRVISVEEVRAYKPHPLPYRFAAEQLGDRILLVSAHAWDVLGAQAAGFDAVWVDRGERVWPFPDGWSAPSASTLPEAVRTAFAHRS